MKAKLFWPELRASDLNDYAPGFFARNLLAEGDSWFAWGYIRAEPSPNVLSALDFPRSTAIVSYGFSGHTVGDMARMAVSSGFRDYLSAQRFDGILLSGGGNDLFDAIREGHILKAPGSADPDLPESYVDWTAVGSLKDYVARNYAQIIGWRGRAPAMNRTTPIILHTYDIPTPRPAPALVFGAKGAGPWLIGPLTDVGAPVSLQRPIVEKVAAELLQCVLDLDSPTDGIYVVETRGRLRPAAPGTSREDGDWANEIHPNEAGYGKIAARIQEKLRTLGLG